MSDSLFSKRWGELLLLSLIQAIFVFSKPDTDYICSRSYSWSEGTQIGLSGGIDEPIAARIKTVSPCPFSLSCRVVVTIVARALFLPLPSPLPPRDDSRCETR